MCVWAGVRVKACCVFRESRDNNFFIELLGSTLAIPTRKPLFSSPLLLLPYLKSHKSLIQGASTYMAGRKRGRLATSLFLFFFPLMYIADTASSF